MHVADGYVDVVAVPEVNSLSLCADAFGYLDHVSALILLSIVLLNLHFLG